MLEMQGIVNSAKIRSSLLALDLMSSSEALADLFSIEAIKGKLHKFGLAVSFTDKRDDSKKERDEKLGIKQLEGDILKKDTWKKIGKELNGRKADLIIERGAGALSCLPLDVDLFAILMRKVWRLLTDRGGILLVETPIYFAVEQKPFECYSAEIIIKSWMGYLKAANIRAVYEPLIAYDYDDRVVSGALKLVKSADSAKKLPLPPLKELNKYLPKFRKQELIECAKAEQTTLKLSKVFKGA